jgi:hypothetical protein
MKTLIASASAAALACLAPAMAHAQMSAAAPTGLYGNLGYGYIDGQGSGHLDAAIGRLGYRFMPYFGVEGEGALGIGSDHDTIVDPTTGASVRASLKLKHELAAYAVGFAPLSDKTDLFARIGYGTQKFRAKAAGFSASDSVESVNYGLGAQHHFDGVNGVRAEWTRYDLKEGLGHSDTYSVTYSRRF